MVEENTTTKGDTKGKAEGSSVAMDVSEEYDTDRARMLAAFIVNEAQSDTAALALAQLVGMLADEEDRVQRNKVKGEALRGAFDETDEFHGGALASFEQRASAGMFTLLYPNGEPFKV